MSQGNEVEQDINISWFVPLGGLSLAISAICFCNEGFIAFFWSLILGFALLLIGLMQSYHRDHAGLTILSLIGVVASGGVLLFVVAIILAFGTHDFK